METRLPTCTLRPWRRGDEESLAKYANNRNVWLNLRDLFPHPYTMADAKAWIRANVGANPLRNFAIDVGGEAVGSVGIAPQADVHRRSAEIGYWLAEPFWGRGIMTDAVRAATDYGFATFEVVRIHASVFEGNPASMRVLEKCGYEREGWLRKSVWKDGRLLDAALYARLLA